MDISFIQLKINEKKYLVKVLFDDIFATYDSIISSIFNLFFFLNSSGLQYDFLTT